MLWRQQESAPQGWGRGETACDSLGSCGLTWEPCANRGAVASVLYLAFSRELGESLVPGIAATATALSRKLPLPEGWGPLHLLGKLGSPVAAVTKDS